MVVHWRRTLVHLQQFGTFILAAERTSIIAKLVLVFSIDLIKTNDYIRLQIFVLTYKLRKYKRSCNPMDALRLQN